VLQLAKDIGLHLSMWLLVLSAVCSPTNAQTAPAELLKPETVIQVGHRRAIHAASFSPDGRWMASGAKDDTIKIWEVATGRLLRTLYGHGGPVNALAVSPDGRFLASGGGDTYDARYANLFFTGGQVGGFDEDTTVRLWDVASGRQIRVFTGHTLSVMAIAFSADGKTLTSASSDSIKVWDVSTGAALRSMPVFPPPKGSSPFRPTLKTKDKHIEKWEKTFTQLASEILISDRGELVAAAQPGKKFHIFDTVRMRKLHELDIAATPGAPGSLAFSRDAQLVAYIKNEKEIAVQNVSKGKDLWHSALATSGHGGFICFTPDGRGILTELPQGTKRELQTWSSSDGKPVATATINDDRVSRLIVFAPDGLSFVMIARDGHALELRDTKWAQLARSFGSEATGRGRSGQDDAAIRKQLMKVGLAQEAELSEAEDDLGDFSAKNRAGEAITFTLDNRWLLTKSGRQAELSTAVWDVTTGTEAQDLGGVQLNQIGNPNHSPDGRFQIVPEYALDSKASFQTVLAFSKAYDPSLQGVKLMDARNGHKLHTFSAGRDKEIGGVPAAGFSLDSSQIAITGYKSRKYSPEIFVYETGSGKKVTQFGSPQDQDKGPIEVLAISRDLRVMAVGFRNQDVWLMDATDGKILLKIPHPGGATALSFSADGRLLALLGKDGDAYLFDAHAGQLLATLISAENGEWLVVAPDGKFDGSPGGWKQILWRFSGDTFSVAPVETFFNEFYYPGLLAEILAGKKLHETRDFAQLDRRQPSLAIEVEGLSTAPVNSRTIKVRLKVAEAKPDKDHPQGSTVRDVRLFRNGSLVNTWRGGLDLDAEGKALLETTMPIVAGQNRLVAYAFNGDDIKSPDASVVVTGGPALKRAGSVYVLSVGINQYRNAEFNLKFAVADSQDVAGELRAQQNKLGASGRVEVVELIDADATKKNVLLALKRLAGTATGPLPAGAPAALEKLQPAQPEDEVFLYFAGHGAATDLRFFLIPHDLGYAGGRTEMDAAGWMSIMDHSISDLELEDALEKVDARDILLVIDACNSGQALEAEETRRGPMNSRGLAQLAYEKGMYVLTAAQGYQAALEVKELGHGLLTYALVEEGLKTPVADKSPKDGKIVAREWMDYAAMRVPELQEAQIEAAQKQGRSITFAEGGRDARGEASHGLQRPRVFYRREQDPDPLVVAKP
jgi:WD40 repeat protein